MFCDITKITVKAGRGGDGCTSARREKCVPFGGPDGGDGGKGGDLIIRVNPHLNSLIDLHTKKRFFAEAGEQGMKKDMHGRDGEDLIIEVPKGTQIKNISTGDFYDLKEDNSEALIDKGGRGGYGNAHFTSSTRRYPEFHELGEPTKEMELELELKLVADVGIIGLPSSGKSSLINRISNVKAKTGDYHFTTLIPNIGVVKVFDKSLVVTDIPGLIEGASEGKGLGAEFLRHISRNSVLIHLVDGNSMDPVADFKVIQKELAKYSKELAEKSQILAINKIDLLDEEAQEIIKEQFESDFKGKIFFVSAVAGAGTKELLGEALKLVEKEKAVELQRCCDGDTPQRASTDDSEQEPERITYTPHLNVDPKSCKVTKIGEAEEEDEEGFVFGEVEMDPEENLHRQKFLIEGQRIEQIAKMTNFDQKQGIERLYDVLLKMKVQGQLEKLGAQEGDILHFGDFEKTLAFRERL